MTGTQLCPRDAQPRDPAVAETPLAKLPVSGRSLLPLCFPNSRGRVSWFGEMCSAKRAKLASGRRFLWGLSAAELQKGNSDASSTPSLRPGPKNHHFLLACESLINSRQKALIRKLFGKWRGRGRDRCSPPRPVALGGFAPRRPLPAPWDGSQPRGPHVCFGHGLHPKAGSGTLPVWLQPKFPSGWTRLSARIWG